jgi:hypothetical protein
MLRAKHALTLAGEFTRYAYVNRNWWAVPVLIALILVVLVIAVGQAASYYSLYTVF